MKEAEDITVIEPKKGWLPIDLKELMAYRELLYFLSWRDIKVRYKQTIIGAAWAIIQPLFSMIVFSIFFGHYAKMPSDGVPYPIFAYTALVPWMFFSNGINQSGNSLVNSAHLIRKVYFPRIIIPVSSVLSGVLDFIIAFAMLIVMMLFYGIVPTANIIWFPFFLLLAAITALGVGFWLSALNVQFRDVKYVIPFMVQFWLFSTPIAYPSSILREPFRSIYGMNPMVGVVEGFRWSLLGTEVYHSTAMIVSTTFAILLFVSGAFYFKRMEKNFSDMV